MRGEAVTASHRLINYALRPAKTAERKIVCDIIRRLEPFERVENYRYVGFGSIYFSDFQLFHQALGISDMASVEKDIANLKRFEFNLPYGFIRLIPGHSNLVLPTLSWDKRCVIWLDYESKLDKKALADIATFCARARSGSMLLITLNAEPERIQRVSPEEQADLRLQALRDAVGEDKVARDVRGSDLRGDDFAKVCRRIVLDEVAACLADRSGPLPHEEKFVFPQIAFFLYADDARMMTLAGVLLEERERVLFEKSAFPAVPFFRDGETPYVIKAPRFTQKELHRINSLFPIDTSNFPEVSGIPASDIQDYIFIYRYYPLYCEVLLG
jgi:hypothetical protein